MDVKQNKRLSVRRYFKNKKGFLIDFHKLGPAQLATYCYHFQLKQFDFKYGTREDFIIFEYCYQFKRW